LYLADLLSSPGFQPRLSFRFFGQAILAQGPGGKNRTQQDQPIGGDALLLLHNT
jgi:hypothetical protein